MTTLRGDLLVQGAESKVYKGVYCGKPAVFKHRFIKGYRLKQLDDLLTKERIKSEARSLLRCRQAGVRVPCLYFADLQQRMIITEYLHGCVSLKERFEDLESRCENDIIDKLLLDIGVVLAKLHKNHIIHGDLTTSNLMADGADNIFVIDFGLSYIADSDEDKGVDLYVLERAFVSTHPNLEKRFPDLVERYRGAMGNAIGGKILAKYDEVKLRGRKRTMEG